MGKIHIHKEDTTLRSLLDRIQGIPVPCRKDVEPLFREPVPEPNRSVLLAFYRSMVTEELSVGRMAVVLGNMYRISIWMKHMPFEQMMREDIIDLVEKIKAMRHKRMGKFLLKETYAEQTVESYKTAIKKFWKWLKPQEIPEAYPPEVSWIHRKKKKNGLLPKDLWTPDEVNRLAGLAGNMRDRAFILGLFGSGCRIGEFLPLRRKDVVFDAYSAQVLVDGKTGSRRVRLTPTASVAMAGWLEIHPNRNPDAPVWVEVQTRQRIPDHQLTYDWAHEMLKRTAMKAGVAKPIRPHLLRHSLATFYAPRLTEAVMNEHFGWAQGGRTAAIYTHLSGRQVDDQILAVFGKKKVDTETNEAVEVLFCPRCGLESSAASTQCGKCGFPLTDQAAREIIARRQAADRIMDAVTARPEIMDVLTKAIEAAVSQDPELVKRLLRTNQQ